MTLPWPCSFPVLALGSALPCIFANICCPETAASGAVICYMSFFVCSFFFSMILLVFSGGML